MKKRLFVTLSVIAAVILAGIAVVFLISPEKHRLNDTVRAASGYDYIALSEGVTEYEITGPEDGTPVILVHGMSVPMYDWDRQVPYLADRGFRVIRYNHYGRAYSDRPRGTYDRSRYVRQLNELMEALNIDKAHLVVHSMGGVIGVSFAQIHPEKTDKIVLIAPAFYMAEDNGGIAAIRVPILGDILAKTMLPGMLADRADGLFFDAGIPEAEEYSAAFREQMKYAGFSRSVKSLFRNGMADELSEPYSRLEGEKVLLIRGTRDNSIPKKHFAAISELLPSMRVEIIQGAGHCPNFEYPEEVNSLIVDFLAGN